MAEKSIFRTQFDRIRKTTATGEKFAPTFSLRVSDTGEKVLEKTGSVNVYANIQAYKESCDIHFILERFANGDTQALNKATPSFGDFTEFPTTYADLLQRTIDAENMFMSLPVEVRAEYNHSPSEFFTSIGTEKFDNTYKKYFGAAEEQVAEVIVTPDPDPVPVPTDPSKEVI